MNSRIHRPTLYTTPQTDPSAYLMYTAQRHILYSPVTALPKDGQDEPNGHEPAAAVEGKYSLEVDPASH